MFSRHLIWAAMLLIASMSLPIVHASTSLQAITGKTPPAIDQRLTGYGRIKAWSNDSLLDGCQLWLVDCEDQAHAKLLQAKFISDTQVKNTDGKIIAAGKTQCFQTAQGHGIGALRHDNAVILFTLKDSTKLNALAKTLADKLGCDPADLTWNSDAKIPMYLDRFDRHGFRFYYRPWEVPDESQVDTYNPVNEFDYAKSHGDLGFVFWNPFNEIVTGEGFFNQSWWSWAMEEATKRNLPVQVNTGLSYQGSTWMVNQHPETVTEKMPQFVGGMHRIADPHLGGQGVLYMGDNIVRRNALGLIKNQIDHFSQFDNVLSYQEPYGEVHHGQQDLFLDYGPAVDKAYANWLMERYHSLTMLNLRWFGDETLKAWSDVKFPEVAYFMGFDDNALDLTGTWKINFTDEGKDCPADWYKQNFDDSQWGDLVSPGNDQTMFLPKKPAVYRRRFDLPARYKASGKRVWLYLWDLTDQQRLTVTIDLNDKRVSSTQSKHTFPHWVAVDVTDTIRTGSNFLALGLPRGFMAYRLYLSHQAPSTYPGDDEHRNAQWADFMDFVTARRAKNVHMGLQMIRQADENRGITMMAPDYVADTLKDYAHQYNGNFHNTGYMSAFWADYLPMLMRSIDRPMTLEPGGPAKDAKGMEKMVGCWLTEGINGIDYFIHIGSVLWNKPVLEKFEHYLPAIQTVGTYHQPKAQIAQLISSRVKRLTGFPWHDDPDRNVPTGYWRWNLSSKLSSDYRIDAVCETDFASKLADDYKLIVDTNTTILSEQDVYHIDRWVRDGGIFVTFIQTGRHTPEKGDSWPISKLSGYEVLSCDPVTSSGKINRAVKAAPNVGDYQLPRTLLSAKGHGLRLKATSADCKDLMLWDDGTVAMGYRQLGKGYVVHIGANFASDRLWFGNQTAMIETIRSVFDFFKMDTLPGSAPGVRFRHYVSNNGLYDYWAMWNESNGKAMTKLDIYGHNPGQILDVIEGKTLNLATKKHGARLANLILEPNEAKLFRTPRQQVANAPAHWLTLQSNWWKDMTGDPGKAYDMPTYPNTLHLSEGWTPVTHDPVWPSRLDIAPNEASQAKQTQQTFTRTFTVPNTWTDGKVLLWMHSWIGKTFLSRARVTLDDSVLIEKHFNGLDGIDVTNRLKPGSTHTITVELESDQPLIGMRGEAWLAYLPKPIAEMDLAGDWEFSTDAVNFDRTSKLPGRWDGQLARRQIDIPETYKDKQTFLRIGTTGRVVGVIVNGKWRRAHHHAIGHEFDINITRLIQFGQPNAIKLVHYHGPGKADVQEIKLYFQD